MLKIEIIDIKIFARYQYGYMCWMLIFQLHNIIMKVLSRFVNYYYKCIMWKSYNEHALKIEICVKMVDTMCWN